MPIKKSPSLPKLQGWLRGVLTHPAGVGTALRSSSAYLHVIGQTREVSRERRLSIYGNGYFGRLIDTLGANYSSVKNVTGPDEFHDLARAYLVKHPSTFKSIDDVGHRMAAFLKRHPLARAFPFLPDLAALEWTAHQAFFADDLPLLDPRRFRSIPPAAWPRAKLMLDPSAAMLKLDWPVDGLWRDDGQWDKRRVRGLKKDPLHVLVFRRTDGEKWVRVSRLTPAQYGLLDRLARKEPLGRALLALSPKHASLPIQEWFEDWVGEGIIKKIAV